jgi:tetratricopeptide (TPR) repeat protein
MKMQVAQKIGRNDPCPCGSKRKYKQCCSEMGATRPRERGEQLFAKALRSFQLGSVAEAVANFRLVLADQPDHAGANYLLGHHALQSGEPGKAVMLMSRAFAAGLQDAAAHYHYGTALAMLGRYSDAAFQFAEAVAQRSDFEDARVNLANAYFELGAFPEAGEQYKLVIGRNPSNWKAHHNLAHVYYCLGDIEEAVHFFRKTIAGNPGYAEAHASFAAMLELNNQPEEAAAVARQSLALQPGNASAQCVLAKCLRRQKRYGEALSALDSIDPRTASQRTYITTHNERGQNLDRLGRYGEAYQAFTASKQALARLRNIGHDPLGEFQPLEAAEVYFTPQKMEELRKLIGEGVAMRIPIPVFVTGFHRSGTTLIEQILSSHPQIGAAGELEAIPRLLAVLSGGAAGLPATLEKLLDRNDAAPLLEFRSGYLAHLMKQKDFSGKRWVVDKSLFNMLHLPLIRLLFPESPVIHVLRHPLDSVISVYSQNFLWGNDWSLTMPDIARAFERTWMHAGRMAPRLERLRYMRFRYEDIIAGPEGSVRSMLGFIGADYDPACLNFHENSRVARTASYEQISQPIYSTSVERYFNYMPFIAPEVADTLHPVASSMGYAIRECAQVNA